MADLPCDGDGVCMLCKVVPPDSDVLLCNSCVSPWHMQCLKTSLTAVSAGDWFCPDCSITNKEDHPNGVQSSCVGASDGDDLVSQIRAIQADPNISEDEKAKKRQALMTRGETKEKVQESDEGKEEVKVSNSKRNEVLELFDESLNCIFCMQLSERPVTTPCGHNFCLKCFQKWMAQGKKNCAKCRSAIPHKMASQPRINSTLVIAIRMAKAAAANASDSSRTPKPYNTIENQNKPDKAFTTERAKKTGMANAASGRIFVTVPPDHFGPILAENDPERNQGVLVGECWGDRMECRQWGVHLPHVAGISGQSDYGAQSVALSGGYEDDEDHGEWFLYTGSGGRDLSGNKRTNKDQSFDQTFDKYNEALRVSCKEGYPVRVVRSHKEKRSSYAPENGVRYDGVYRIEKCWRKKGIQGFKVCRYLFVRCDNEPAPWTSDEHGDRPRPLPKIKELEEASDITDRKKEPAWDWKDERWGWTRDPPASRKLGSRQGSDGSRSKDRPRQFLTIKQRLLKEFSCSLCKNVMNLPMSTPCGHSFCKPCIEDLFAGHQDIRERSTSGGRSLRAQKIVKKCPSCQGDITDFLLKPQVNRQMEDVIRSLKRKREDGSESDGDVKEDGNQCDDIKNEDAETEECGNQCDDIKNEDAETEECGNQCDDIKNEDAETEECGNQCDDIKNEDAETEECGNQCDDIKNEDAETEECGNQCDDIKNEDAETDECGNQCDDIKNEDTETEKCGNQCDDNEDAETEKCGNQCDDIKNEDAETEKCGNQCDDIKNEDAETEKCGNQCDDIKNEDAETEKCEVQPMECFEEPRVTPVDTSESSKVKVREGSIEVQEIGVSDKKVHVNAGERPLITEQEKAIKELHNKYSRYSEELLQGMLADQDGDVKELEALLRALQRQEARANRGVSDLSAAKCESSLTSLDSTPVKETGTEVFKANDRKRNAATESSPVKLQKLSDTKSEGTTSNCGVSDTCIMKDIDAEVSKEACSEKEIIEPLELSPTRQQNECNSETKEKSSRRRGKEVHPPPKVKVYRTRQRVSSENMDTRSPAVLETPAKSNLHSASPSSPFVVVSDSDFE